MLIKVIKDSIIYKSEIKAVNAEFECDDAIADSLIKRKLAEKVETFKGFLDPEHLADEFSYQELKKLASDMGLSAKGTKDELIERISAVEVETGEIVGEEKIDEVLSDENEDEPEELPNTEMPE